MSFQPSTPTGPTPAAQQESSLPQWLNKVPLITAIFWVIKVLCTTIGETFADFLAVNVGLGPAITDGLMLVLLIIMLIVQMRTNRYKPVIYWTTVVLVSVVGTLITDLFTDVLGVSLWISTAVFTVLLAVVFIVWYRQEHTLAITSINTRRREGFYWGAVLTTFALGTAAGDLATEALGLGFRNGILAFGVLILVSWIAYKLGANPVAMFWCAYILTRPLGASIGDFLTQDRQYGGIGLGAPVTSLLFFAAIIVLVTREQLRANRHEVSDGSKAGGRSDLVWAVSATVAVALAATGIAVAHPAPAPSAAAASHGPLGDLSPYSTIVDDVSAKVNAGDLEGGKTRVKDLEVAWDANEAGLKPRNPAAWRQMDGAIDDVLTALRENPNQANCQQAIAHLQDVIKTLQ